MNLDRKNALNVRFFIFWFVILLVVNCLVINYLAPYNSWYRYYGVAFQMWHNHNFWYPLWQDNSINLQKGPLLYWLVLSIWKLFGLTMLAPFVLIGISYAIIAYYTYKIAFYIFKDNNAAILALFCFGCNTSILIALQWFQFDIVLTACYIASFYFLLTFLDGLSFSIIFFAITVILGLLIKGPVFLFFTAATLIVMSIVKRKDSQALKQIIWITVASIIAILLTAIYVVIVNHKTDGLFLNGLLHQTLQRFDLKHPDPNRGMDFIQKLTWFQILRRPLDYSSFFIIQNGFFILLFLPQIIKGWRFIYTVYGKLFFSICTITVIFFGLFVGQFQMRYIYPITPLANLFVVGCILTCGDSVSEKKWRIIKFLLIIIFCYFVFLPFTKIFSIMPSNIVLSSQKQLQYLANKQISLYTISDDWTSFATGWPRYLAQSTKISQITSAQFEQSFPNQKTDSWCVVHVRVPDNKILADKYLLYYPSYSGGKYETSLLMNCNELSSSKIVGKYSC